MSGIFTTAIEAMLANPPDPNAPIPMSNRKGTIFGITIPFLVLSWLVVGFRLHTRFRVVCDPGFDDLFVILAALFNLMSAICFLAGTSHGLGHQLLDILPILTSTMHWLYVTNASYYTATVLIKVSLLFQYLRLFSTGIRRKICIVLLCIVAVWGTAFIFMTWVPCFPVSGFWNRTMVPPAKCYGFGYRTFSEAKTFVLVFSGTNMAFDVVLFAIPLTEYFRENLARKQFIAMTGLFTLGSIVILMAILRMWGFLKHSTTLEQTTNFPWWYPQILIISCLEIDFAIMSASMPIFWPSVVATLGQIFVTNEVHVTHHERFENNSRENFELDRSSSIKSSTSTEGLTLIGRGDHKPYYVDAFAGNGSNTGITQVEVQSYAQQPRKL